MNKSLAITLDAKADLAEARDWYDNQQPGVGDEFLDYVNSYLAKVQESPASYEKCAKDVRRIILRKFPFFIIFREEQERIVILGVIHGGRHSRIWKSRVKD